MPPFLKQREKNWQEEVDLSAQPRLGSHTFLLGSGVEVNITKAKVVFVEPSRLHQVTWDTVNSVTFPVGDDFSLS